MGGGSHIHYQKGSYYWSFCYCTFKFELNCLYLLVDIIIKYVHKGTYTTLATAWNSILTYLLKLGLSKLKAWKTFSGGFNIGQLSYQNQTSTFRKLPMVFYTYKHKDFHKGKSRTHKSQLHTKNPITSSKNLASRIFFSSQ